MKRNEIKVGVVYAYQRSRGYGAPEPIVFLAAPADGPLYSTSSGWRRSDGPAFIRALPDAKPSRSGSSWDIRTTGYPVAVLTLGRGSETDLAALFKLTLDDFEQAVSPHATSVAGAYFDVITTLGQITGPYEEKLAEYEEQRRNERTEQERVQEQDRARRNRALGIADKLHKLGITADTYGDFTEVHLSLDEADKLLALLASKP